MTNSTPTPGIFEGSQTQKSADLAQEIREAGGTLPTEATTPKAQAINERPLPGSQVFETKSAAVSPIIEGSTPAPPIPTPSPTDPATESSQPADDAVQLTAIRHAAAGNSLHTLEAAVFGQDEAPPAKK